MATGFGPPFSKESLDVNNLQIFRCTLTKIPETQSLLQKARLPLGILIHPFRDVDHLPVIQSSTIVRCRSCRTYINPYVQFVERQKWKCNICFRINALPEDFMFDPSSRKYGDPERRPEVRHATVEFIAPSEYMLRPPQPAVYLFVLDVSHGAIQTGYLSCFCKVLLEELDNIPGDSRTQVGFITFDSSVHFYNLGEGLSQPQMLLVSDIEGDTHFPVDRSLLQLVQELLTNLPAIHAHNGEPTSALGAAVQAAYKLMSPVGGRVSVFQTCLPNVGPGNLKPREDPNQRAGKDSMGDSKDCVIFQFRLPLELPLGRGELACFINPFSPSPACISKYSAGCINYYPGLHSTLNKGQMEKFEAELRYYVTRKIGFEAVMRIRCTKGKLTMRMIAACTMQGLMIHTFHGNFFVRATDLLSLPNVNPDAGFGMQIAIEESLTDCNLACFQAAVLYTSSRGERRIRVHTLSLPVTALLQDILGSIDQEAVVGLLCKMAVDRSLSSSVVDARDALVNACQDLVQAFRATLSAGQASAGLPIPHCARLVPLFVLALMKHTAFRVGVSTKLDDRVFAMEQMKSMPLSYLMTYIYPALYPVHMLDDQNALKLEDGTLVSQPPRLQLSFEKIDRHGCYLLDTVERLYLYLGRAVSDRFCVNVLGASNFSAVPDDMTELPELSTPESERVRNFIAWNLSRRPYYSPLRVIREDSKDRHLFVQHLVDDRTESALSYYEFLQHLKQQLSK
ncbi:protein transport protein Sec24A, putative [Ixodes scapularis]|uniref:Protein transport protein Sec24A, putative n=1 Tax=Ixodes scapularis TaxID=6945 RepID=B7P481_IXOSC|nr:protein transport protein Sec24A, putative [Ixodes scapularis]|eukprot:XP_002405557.1 protein transport protein Sec24A, putative [Ixodes scapularis]